MKKDSNIEKGFILSGIEFKKDYNCFSKNEKYNFKPGLNLIVGDQGCGKSTLLRVLTNQVSADVNIETAKPSNWYYFDSEYNNPRIKSSIEYEKDPVQILQSKFQSHGEALLPMILCIEQAKDTIIFLDEPESGLSIRSQLKVIDSIKKAIEQGSQLIISTHSLFLIDYAGEVLSLEHKKWMSSKQFIKLQKNIMGCKTGSPYCFENKFKNEDENDHSENVREDLKSNWTKEERIKLSEKFGPNWASIITGCGDQ